MATKPDPIVNERRRTLGEDALLSCGRNYRFKIRRLKSQAQRRNRRVPRAKLTDKRQLGCHEEDGTEKLPGLLTGSAGVWELAMVSKQNTVYLKP